MVSKLRKQIRQIPWIVIRGGYEQRILRYHRLQPQGEAILFSLWQIDFISPLGDIYYLVEDDRFDAYSSVPNNHSAIFINFGQKFMRYIYFTCAIFINFPKF